LDEIVSWLVEEKRKVKERLMGMGFDRFYPIGDIVPSVASFKKQSSKQALREVHALQEIFMVEASSSHAKLMEHLVSARHDPIEGDFKREIEHLKHLIREHEREYAQREKLVITQSKKHIYVKRGEGRIVLSGDTFPVKEELKKKGFRWDPTYKVWYVPDKGIDLSKLLRELEAL